MTIVDVCENSAGVGCLKQYYKSNKITDYKIICMEMNLSIGDIKNDRIMFMKNLYKEGLYDYSGLIDKLVNSLDDNTKVRIWSSRNNSDDYLMLLFLCHLLKDKSNNISVIYVDDFDESLLSINFLSYKEIDKVLKYEKQLTLNDINKYSNDWQKLVEVNSDLRVSENGIIINKKYSDYDDVILDILNSLGQCKFADLVGELMVNQVINDVDGLVYQYLIDRLISLNKIKVIKKGTRHFYDVVEKN